MNHVQPTILVSKCLGFDHCRYDGSIIGDDFVAALKNYVKLVLVCPEVMMGLPIPREAIRIIREEGQEKLVFSYTGTDIGLQMDDFTQKFLVNDESVDLHGAILKGRSPSCGPSGVKVYKHIGKSMPLEYKREGFFAKGLMKEFPLLAIEDEGRLKNYTIREHFLTRIYTMARFSHVKTHAELIEFHSKNKYLLMAYHQRNQKLLGKIVANHQHEKIGKLLGCYKTILMETILKPLRPGSNINMLLHIFGYFKKVLSSEEKAYFLDVLEQYSANKVPLSVPLFLLNSWVVRTNEEYLAKQSIFAPYPKELLDVLDSGKSIIHRE